MSNGCVTADRAECTSFKPFPVITATTLARRPTVPSASARRRPATAVAAAGSAKMPVSRKSRGDGGGAFGLHA
jgi:hypothetical protein